MKIVKPSAVLESELDEQDILLRLEQAGRTCYKSEAKITEASANDFVFMLIQRGHESVLEHACATFRITCDRGVSHELVRHRVGVAYSQESSRYCNYGNANEIQVIEPPQLGSTRSIWMTAMRTAEEVYLSMIRSGVAPQIARSVLPTCLKTEIVVTANLREWRTILKQRTSKAAHPQMREIMLQVLDVFKEKLPVIVSDIVPES